MRKRLPRKLKKRLKINSIDCVSQAFKLVSSIVKHAKKPNDKAVLNEAINDAEKLRKIVYRRFPLCIKTNKFSLF